MIRQAFAFIVEDVAFSQEINNLPRGREASACRVSYASATPLTVVVAGGPALPQRVPQASG